MQTLRTDQWFPKAENEYCPAQVFAGDYGQPVADVFGNTKAERVGRANLISASRELLEVTRMFVDSYQGVCLFDVLNPCTLSKKAGIHWGSTAENIVRACAVCSAKAVIAKAEGKS